MKTTWLLLLVACGAPLPLGSPDATVVHDAGTADLDAGATATFDAGHDAGVLPDVPFAEWRQREPLYELYIRHFSPEGNFRGVEARLRELKALGIGIVWLLPVHEIGSKVAVNGGQGIDAPHGNPYAVKSYEKLNPEYGTEDDFRSLVQTAHRLGMHVILDWVPNHTAWDHPFVTEHPDWYVRSNGAIHAVNGFPWIAQLDWSNPNLRAYMKRVMADWVRRFELDGFRIDFAHHMPVDFFAELRAELERIRPVFLLAEAGDVGRHPVFDMTYDWDVYPLLGDVAHRHKTVSAIDDALYHRQFVPYVGLPSSLVMRMTYNHDDNGNWTLAQRYREGIKAFAVLACTLPGKPMIFDGQEVGMNVFDGTRVLHSAPLTHDPKVKIDWSDPEGYRPFYTRLLRLHRGNSALGHAGHSDFRKVDTAPSDYAYAFVRRDGDNQVLVVLNLSDAVIPALRLTPTPNAGDLGGEYVELFSGTKTTIAAGDTLQLGPWEYRVFVRGPLE